MLDITWRYGRSMRVARRVGAAGVVMVLAVAPRQAAAQGKLNAGCQASAALFQDACQKTVDFFDYLAPQLATAIAGGNANLGQAGALGGLGHFSIGIRATAVDGDIPKVNNVTLNTTGPVADTFGVTRVPVPMLTADAGIGIFKGVPLGVTHIFGVDALVSALYVPTYNSSNVSVDPQHSLRLGYGARLGLVQEHGFVPAVSMTYLQRGLPQTTLSAVTNGDSLRVENLDITTKSWRLVAGKHLLFLGLSGGYGKDEYDASTIVGATVTGVSSGATALAAPSMSMTRTNYFGDLSLDFPVINLAAEIGKVSGGTIATYNYFDGKPAGAARLYASAGMRIKI
jgi:hypothetical protein